MKSYSLGTLRSMARRRGELGADDNDPYWLTAELNEWINASRDALRDLAAEADPDRYTARATIAVTAGTESYALDAATLAALTPSCPPFHKELALWVEDSSADTGWIQVPRIELDRIHRVGRSSADVSETWYYVEEQKLWLHPNPGWSADVQLVYLQATVDMASDAATCLLTPHELEWLMLDVLLKAADKESDNEAWQRRARMQAAVTQRMQSRPQINQSGPHRGSNVWS